MKIGQGVNWREARKALQVGPLVEGQPAAYVHAAQTLASRGRRAEAAAALEEALRVDPNHLPALRALASLAQSLGAPALAAELRQRVVAIEVAGLSLEERGRQEAMEFRQALAGDAPPPERVPAAYLTARYDAWADDFEHDLRERLHYQGPELLHAAIARVREPAAATLDVLDLGCGTGLMAPLVRPWARRLHGIDLSPKMLEQARRRGLYDELAAEDLSVTLERKEACWDLILAAEVFNYLGNLGGVFAAAARALRPGGLFAFTAEADAEPGYRLCPTGRFVHSLAYLREQADAAGFQERSAEVATLRFENDRPVSGHIVVLQGGRGPETASP